MNELSEEARLVLEKYQPETQQEGDFTTTDAQKLWDVSRSVARSVLADMVENGEIIRIEDVILKTKKRGLVFRPATKKQLY